MRLTRQGMSLVVVLLFTALFISALMVSASFANLGAKSTAANESRSTNALFAADSLMSRIEAKLKSQPALSGSLTAADILTFLTTQGVATLTLPNAATASIAVAKVDTTVSPVLITLRSTGTSNGATQVVLKEFKVTSLGGTANISTPGALNAYPPVTGNGQPNIIGQAGAGTDGVIVDRDGTQRITLNDAVPLTTLAYGTSMTIQISDPRNPTTTARVTVPSYIEMSTSSSPVTKQRFKVTAKTNTGLTVTPIQMDPLSTAFTGSFATGTEIGMDALAVTQPIGTGGLPITDVMNLPVTDAYSFYAKDLVYVKYRLANGTTGDAIGSVQARVQASGASDSSGTSATNISVNFAPTSACTVCTRIPTGATISEGTPLRREVYGVVSQSTVTQKNANFTYSQNDTRIASPYGLTTTACPSGDQLFCETFKMDYNAFIAKYPAGNLSSLNGISGITVVNTSNGWNGSNGICGSGILVVIGDLSANSANNCSTPFRGLIYVTGNAKLQGNLQLIGGMVVEGDVTNKEPIGFVDVGGSGAQTDRLTYDLMSLKDVSQLLAGQTFQPVQGTWRQQ